ncbi:hypothetical protein SASPL_148195 [Salvia splendens]|uniref:Uncharacterized protein n=1 Tax=Salvia splendens TaxID=180675 RepID=A0A8X8W9A3_SALSN|nr:hypothetical protein SASPL_148195 [Salvia splendens]
MSSKALLLLGLFLAVAFLISSEVASATDLASVDPCNQYFLFPNNLIICCTQPRKPMGAADTIVVVADTVVEATEVAVEVADTVVEATEVAVEAVEVAVEAVEVAVEVDMEATEGARAEEATEASVVGAEATVETKVATDVPTDDETQELSHC